MGCSVRCSALGINTSKTPEFLLLPLEEPFHATVGNSLRQILLPDIFTPFHVGNGASNLENAVMRTRRELQFLRRPPYLSSTTI